MQNTVAWIKESGMDPYATAVPRMSGPNIPSAPGYRRCSRRMSRKGLAWRTAAVSRQGSQLRPRNLVKRESIPCSRCAMEPAGAATCSLKCRIPPGRNTRCASRSASSASVTEQRTVAHTTASTVASSRGMVSAAPARAVASGRPATARLNRPDGRGSSAIH